MKSLVPFLAFALAGCGSVDVISRLSSSEDEIQGTGKPIVQTRKAQAVSKIEASGALTVEVRQGKETKLTVEAQKEILPHLKTEFKNGTLRMWTEGSINTSGPLKWDPLESTCRHASLSIL